MLNAVKKYIISIKLIMDIYPQLKCLDLFEFLSFLNNQVHALKTGISYILKRSNLFQ